MAESPTSTDRIRAILVIVATFGTIAFNFLATAGKINSVTSAEISDKYPTLVTPAGYAFAIWSLIYAGLIAFSIYQLLPANAARYRNIRTLYVLSCAINCGWLYFWHHDQIAICLGLIVLLAASLFIVNRNLRARGTTWEYWLVKAPFGIYFGWVSAAMLVNFAILLVYLNFQLSETAWTTISVALILFAALLGIIFRMRLSSYLAPLAIAWALTAIAVKQSGHTATVVAAAIGVVVCLIATLSFVVKLPTRSTSTQLP
ncbi:MAG: tryptophan-rich sensory protein [Pyrinomonadaceae bacterium]